MLLGSFALRYVRIMLTFFPKFAIENQHNI
nr:MAG TPA: hypothetical protein [Caudoviricetes sp.]DAU40872.1 MAG TPA: hypothetical protein [Caudoviricetes sp.]